MTVVHASCVAIFGMAVLLRGPSGSGKSDLALRLVDAGAHLVADDQVVLEAAGGRVRASAPASIAGLIEVRGIGLLRLRMVGDIAVGLVVDLSAEPRPDRLPSPRRCRLEGVAVPIVAIDPFAASAAAKVRLAARAIRDGTAGTGALLGATLDPAP